MDRFYIDLDGGEERGDDGPWVRFEEADEAVKTERARILQLALGEARRLATEGINDIDSDLQVRANALHDFAALLEERR